MSDYDPTDTRSQERRQEDAATRAKLSSDTEAEDFKWLMGSKRGRRIVRRIIERSQTGECCFNTNALTMAFNSGRQLEGEYQERLAKHYCPDHYVTLLKETSDEQRNPDDDR